jgi:hypothetical protein
MGANGIPLMGFPKLRDDFIVKDMACLMEQVKAGQLEIDVLKLPLYSNQMLHTLLLTFTQRALLEVFSDLPFLDFLKYRQGNLTRRSSRRWSPGGWCPRRTRPGWGCSLCRRP